MLSYFNQFDNKYLIFGYLLRNSLYYNAYFLQEIEQSLFNQIKLIKHLVRKKFHVPKISLLDFNVVIV